MYLPLILSTLFSLFSPPAPVYHAVVVDARTRQPLPGVVVQEQGGTSSLVTPTNGQFQLAAGTTGPLRLHLSCLGYVPADFERAATFQLDTLRLRATTLALAEVVVHPRRAVTLTPFAKPPHQGPSYYMIPSVQVAVFMPGLEAGQSGQLSQLQLQFKATAIRSGGLRINLRAADVEAGPTGPALLSSPLEVSAAQLVDAPKGLLTLDLAAYGLDMPATGLYVQIEALGFTPDQQYVSLTSPTNGRAPLLVTGSDPQDPHTYQVTRLDEYPLLAAAETGDAPRTWLLGSNGRGWRLRQPLAGKTRTTNSLVSLTVLAN